MSRSSARGFTFIEACVSIVILLTMSALIYPNMVSESTNRKHRLFKTRLLSMVEQARSRALETQRTVALNYSSEDRSIESLEQDENETSKPLPDLILPEGLVAAQLLADKDESPPGGWQVSFYSDGKTTGGGIGFEDRGDTYSLLIDPFTGKGSIIQGNLPDLSKQTWPAGGLQPRAN